MTNSFSPVSTYICKLVLPEPAISQNEESKRVLHGLCSPPTGKTGLLKAVQTQLLSLHNDRRDFHRPASSAWNLFRRKVALNTLLRRPASFTVACTFCACARCYKRVALVYKKDAGQEIYGRNSLYFWSKWNLTISDKNSCILNMQRPLLNEHRLICPEQT